MSRDSTYTQIHTHASHHADLFEEFCRPPSTNPPSTSNSAPQGGTTAQTNNATTTSDPSMVQIPGHFLPFEEIQLPPHLMPLNPEDEDDVVPDMHAAFGIQRALGVNGTGGEGGSGGGAGNGTGRGMHLEPGWRDLGMGRLLEGGGAKGDVVGARREGKRSAILLMR